MSVGPSVRPSVRKEQLGYGYRYCFNSDQLGYGYRDFFIWNNSATVTGTFYFNFVLRSLLNQSRNLELH